MNTTTTIILAVFASTGFWNFLTVIINNIRKKRTPQDNMLLALGRDKLLFLNKKYRKMGYIPDDDYETYIALGEAYEAMEGNSLVKKGFEENLKLPVQEEKE